MKKYKPLSTTFAGYFRTQTKIILLFALAFIVIPPANGQEYKKDPRSREEKQDRYNQNQADGINKMQLRKALEMSGIRIFLFPLKPFDKEYKVNIYIHEYRNEKKVENDEQSLFNNDNIYCAEDNTYSYYEKDANNESVRYKDYINHFNCYTKETDTVTIIRFETYDCSAKRPLHKNKANRSYHWRTYSKIDWVLNEEIPVLVYASSWYDEKYNIYRFCGINDLSLDENATKQLFDSSPHYFVIGYKIFE
jgi:hypothetical protein